MKIVRLSVYARDILEMIPNAPANLWESGLPFLLLLQKMFETSKALVCTSYGHFLIKYA